MRLMVEHLLDRRVPFNVGQRHAPEGGSFIRAVSGHFHRTKSARPGGIAGPTGQR